MCVCFYMCIFVLKNKENKEIEKESKGKLERVARGARLSLLRRIFFLSFTLETKHRRCPFLVKVQLYVVRGIYANRFTPVEPCGPTKRI